MTDRSAVATALIVRDEVLLQTLQLPIDISGSWFYLLDIAQVRHDRNPLRHTCYVFERKNPIHTQAGEINRTECNI